MAEKLSRRQRLAEVVLTNAPMPHRISFIDPDNSAVPGDMLVLAFNSLADLMRWAAEFLPDAEVSSGLSDTLDNTTFAAASGEWGGYPLFLSARWPASQPTGPLNPDQRAQLLAIADAPGEDDPGVTP